MNKEYIYIDGKCIVKDNNGNYDVIDYCDNLDDVLEQENLIEEMKIQINKLTRDSKLLNKNNKRKYFPWILPIIVLITIMIPHALAYFDGDISSFNTYMDSVSLTMGTFYTLVCLAITTPVGLMYEIMAYTSDKESRNNERATNVKLDYLKKQYELEKEKLLNLEKNKNCTSNDKGFHITQVSLDKIKELNGELRYIRT